MPLRLSVLLLTLVPLAALADAPASPAVSLYSRLGGSPKIASLVDATIRQADVSASDRSRVRDGWIARICALSGGGCRAGLATRDESTRMIEALRSAMRAQDVPLAMRNELLDLLARP